MCTCHEPYPSLQAAQLKRQILLAQHGSTGSLSASGSDGAAGPAEFGGDDGGYAEPEEDEEEDPYSTM